MAEKNTWCAEEEKVFVDTTPISFVLDGRRVLGTRVMFYMLDEFSTDGARIAVGIICTLQTAEEVSSLYEQAISEGRRLRITGVEGLTYSKRLWVIGSIRIGDGSAFASSETRRQSRISGFEDEEVRKALTEDFPDPFPRIHWAAFLQSP